MMSRHTASEWAIAVVVPARDEQARLGRCLRSIKRATELVDVPVTVVLVADRCVDRTTEVARPLLDHGDHLVSTDLGCAGAARSLGVNTAIALLSSPLETTWIANTDADTVVTDTWLAAQLAHARSGVAGVTGIVDIRPTDPLLLDRFRATYEVRSDGTHSHVHGANLGIRADAYRAIGGWKNVPTAEDHDLWSRLIQAGYPTVSDENVRVVTSARRVGRAPDGFAADMARLARSLAPAVQ